MPEGEGKESADDGKGEFKEAEGTGLGEGDTKGAKDISDQIKDEDQLLGAKQKGKEEEKEENQDEHDEEKDENKGIEMEEDFDGSLHDIDAPRNDEDDDGSEEEGDDERIEQQMGEDLGDNQETVDERMWGDEDKKEDKPGDGVDNETALDVDDKKDLDYAAGEEKPDDAGKEEKKDKKKSDPPSKQKEQEEMEEGGPDEDVDDNYQDKNGFVKPEAPEEELKLPDDMNLDGGEEEEKGGDGVEEEEEKPGAKEEEKQKGMPEEEKKPLEEAQGANADADKGADDNEDGQDRRGDGPDPDDPKEPDEAPEGNKEDEKMGAEAGEAQDPGAKEEQEKKEEEPPPVQATAGDEGSEEKKEEKQQAGPRGIASSAQDTNPTAARAGQSQGALHQEPQEQDGGLEENQEEAMEEEDKGAGNGGGDDDGASKNPRVGGGREGAQMPMQGQREAGEAGRKKGQKRQQHKPEPNPLRCLGDALERWKADLSVTHDAANQDDEDEEGAAAEDMDEDAARDGQHQFLGADQKRKEGDTQALAPATEDQAKSLQGSLDVHKEGEKDAAEDGDREDRGAMMEEEKEIPSDLKAETEGSRKVSGPAPQKWGGGKEPSKQGKDSKDKEEPPSCSPADKANLMKPQGAEDPDSELKEQEVAKIEQEEREAMLKSLSLDPLAPDRRKRNEEGSALAVEQGQEDTMMQDASAVRLDLDTLPDAQEMEEVDEEELRRQLTERLAAAASGLIIDDPNASVESKAALLQYGSEVWAKCEALTSGLASELTEQLRLILEPTLASKMAGDFKTGKRINMKKVIAYIASHFRQDKIWMRRSGPDKRRYQVLLAVDDSRSMAENGCGGVALESLSLITRAMSRLEVGQVGVLKFGGSDGVVPLHPLDAPFSDSVGPRLAASLRFRGDSTITDAPMAELVQSLGHLLDVARHQGGSGGIGAGTSDLCQLVLILADGRLHEKEALKAAVREVASRPGVCLAFLALDSNAAGGSLLDMQTVSFQGGKPVFSKYLDAFPFPYYVLLKDLAALPRTLAGLLRQWIELASH